MIARHQCVYGMLSEVASCQCTVVCYKLDDPILCICSVCNVMCAHLVLLPKFEIHAWLSTALAYGVSTCAYWDSLHAVNQTADKPYYLFDGYAHLAAGLACGLAGLAAGMAIGIVGDAGVR